MTKGDRLKVRQGWRSLGWAIQPSSGEPDTGEPDARKRARPVREGAVGNLRKPVAPVVRRRESQQGAGRLLHRLRESPRLLRRSDRSTQRPRPLAGAQAATEGVLAGFFSGSIVATGSASG